MTERKAKAMSRRPLIRLKAALPLAFAATGGGESSFVPATGRRKQESQPPSPPPVVRPAPFGRSDCRAQAFLGWGGGGGGWFGQSSDRGDDVAMDPVDPETKYLDALREAAKNPDDFERFVINNGRVAPSNQDSRPPTTEKVAQNDDEASEKGGKGKKGGYRPIEDWDVDVTKEMMEQEKIQFDGQRHGNQLRQNDIIMKNLL